MSNSFRPHGLQHPGLPCPYLSPGVCSNSCPLSQGCHPTILSSVAPFSTCPQSFPASGSFPMSRLFAPGGQSIGASASTSVLPVNIQGWFSCCPKGSQESSPAPQFESISPSVLSLLYGPALSHPYMTTGKIIALTIWTFVSKVMSLLFNMLSRFVMTFLLRSKCLLLSWLQSLSAVMQWFWSPRKENLRAFPLFPHLFARKWWDQMPQSKFFECWVWSQLFHSPLSPSSRGSLVPLGAQPHYLSGS